jgi:RNA polymerase sigma factor (sigma-70 family)
METFVKVELESVYQQYQAELFPYAYNIIGDSLAAEDVVQEILNFYFLNSNEHVQNQKSYLIRSVINRSINTKKSIQVDKKYIGHWLPVPMHTEDNIYREIDKNPILNYSLLVLLERLNPKERAVFILKESFDFAHSEIAEVLGSTVENSRQLYKRARQKLELEEGKSFNSKNKHDAILNQLTDAILNADIEKVKQLLSDNVQSLSDGGYTMRAAPNIINGKENVSRFLRAMYGKYYLEGSAATFEELNHSPAIVFRVNNVIYRCIIFDISDGVIENVYIIVNPDKLRAL